MFDLRKEKFVLVLFLFLAGIIGCDKISSMFPGQQPPATAPAEKPSAVSTPTIAEDPKAPLPPNILAKVGNWTLTKEEFKDRLAGLKKAIPNVDTTTPESKKLILEELIRQQLLVMDAEQTGLANKKEIVEAVSEFKRSLLVQEFATQITKGIEVSPLEAQDFYNQNKGLFAEPADYHVREIMAYTQTDAKDILVDLLKGADFAETAKTRSKAKSADKGGDLGFVSKFSSPQMENTVAAMETGDISRVFKGPDGYFYIVKLDAKKGGEQKSFTAVKDDITAYLLQEKQRKVILDHIDQSRQKTVVKVNESLLQE